MRPALALTTLAVLAAALGLALEQPDRAPAPSASPAPQPATSAAPRSIPGLDPLPSTGPEQVRWRMTYQHQVSMAKETLDPTVVTGEWRVLPIGPDRQRVEFVPDQIDGLEDLPTLAEAHRAFDLGLDAGRLDTIGFAPGTARTAASLLTTLACAFAYTPGDGDAWQVEEEDRLGWFTARYTRVGARVTRRRDGYSRLRNAALGRADTLAPEGDTVYVFDAGGLARIEVDRRLTWSMNADLPPVQVAMRGVLERIDARPAPRPTVHFALADIRSEDPADAGDARQGADAALLEGETRAALLARMGDPALLGHSPDARRARVRSFAQLSALVRQQPDAIADVADALRAGPLDTASTLAGALAEADDPRAVDALAELLGEPLPVGHRAAVARALGGARPVTPAAKAALSDAVAEPELKRAATLAAGTAARGLEEAGDLDGAGDLIDQLIAAWQRATDLPDRLNLLAALGNTASPRVLPVLRGAYADPLVQVRGGALYAMRLQADPGVDALLARELAGGLQMVAARSIGHRDPGLWLPRLEVAVDQVSPLVRPVVEKTIRVWRTQAAMAQR